jgi:dipeptidyl aminopeptidase/acylaminoacyl peptidase
VSLLYREKENLEFKTIKTLNFKETLQPLFFTFDNKQVYALSNLERDKTAIIRYDIANDKEIERLFEHPEVDVMNLSYSKKRKIITAARYYTDKNHFHFFDEQRKKLQVVLEQKLPDYEVYIASMNRAENKVLVRTRSDKSRGSYYFYDLETKEFRKLVDTSPWLNEDHLSDIVPIEYVARDGLMIYGYLTLPRGVEAKNLPVVINPHGGPWVRDYWTFNPEVQFLANRGYAVLQMNFRGSTGYGREFWELSFKQWGKSMQDDITDGVNWLIEQGIADPKRIGIYGASYGGYATLAGLAFTPELYTCGVDYVGVSNIFTLIESIPPYWEPYLEMFYEQVGHPEMDKEYLESVSPYFHVDKIKAPLFIAQGANNPRVKKEQSDTMVEALKERGVEVLYMVKDNEGHGFSNEENRFDFYREMEKFLARHLGGRVEKVQ